MSIMDLNLTRRKSSSSSSAASTSPVTPISAHAVGGGGGGGGQGYEIMKSTQVRISFKKRDLNKLHISHDPVLYVATRSTRKLCPPPLILSKSRPDLISLVQNEAAFDYASLQMPSEGMERSQEDY